MARTYKFVMFCNQRNLQQQCKLPSCYRQCAGGCMHGRSHLCRYPKHLPWDSDLSRRWKWCMDHEHQDRLNTGCCVLGCLSISVVSHMVLY